MLCFRFNYSRYLSLLINYSLQNISFLFSDFLNALVFHIFHRCRYIRRLIFRQRSNHARIRASRFNSLRRDNGKGGSFTFIQRYGCQPGGFGRRDNFAGRARLAARRRGEKRGKRGRALSRDYGGDRSMNVDYGPTELGLL